jgi:predicted DsbA family dithiol-disulfide isomerase
MHRRLFANQRALQRADLVAHARAVGLDGPGFEHCLDSGRHAERVREDLADGKRAGVRGTPTFFLGVAGAKGGPVAVRRVLRGAQAFPGFQAAIDAALAAESNR